MSREPIRVLVACGSACAPLARLIEADPALDVIGEAADGKAAVAFVRKHRPDVVLMDVDMPLMDGFEATRAIMEEFPVPIVICSGATDPHEMDLAFRTMEAGAVSCVPRPTMQHGTDLAAASEHLVRTLKLMSEVKVVRRWPASQRRASARAAAAQPAAAPARAGIRVVAIGASTGGPPLLQGLLAALPKEFAVPILVVQHITRGFLPGFIDWLTQTTGFRIVVASHGARALPGHVYLAPDDFHMGMKASGHIFLSREAPEHGVRPSVSFLFRSLAEEYAGGAVGIVLSGMGKDGGAELRLMKDRGAITIAQDRESSVVHGMPGEAIAQGGATHVLPADRIAEVLVAIVARQNNQRMDDSDS